MLASSSDFFQDLVHNSKSKQHDFFVYLAGVRSKELGQILEYIYSHNLFLGLENIMSWSSKQTLGQFSVVIDKSFYAKTKIFTGVTGVLWIVEW